MSGLSGAGIAISGLVVARGGRRVLDGLSLAVEPGEVYAVLGGNGAGKSTTLSAILGLLKPDAGEIVVAGRTLSDDPDAVRAATAYLPESVALYEHLSALENVVYFLALARVRRERDEIADAFRAVRLEEGAWTRRLGGFSKGMRQKTAIALALLRRAPALLLDEPTTGLDPTAVQDFHASLADLRRRGVCVLMVSHDLLGCADTADRIGVLSGGRISQEWRAASAGPRYDVAALAPRLQRDAGMSRALAVARAELVFLARSRLAAIGNRGPRGPVGGRRPHLVRPHGAGARRSRRAPARGGRAVRDPARPPSAPHGALRPVRLSARERAVRLRSGRRSLYRNRPLPRGTPAERGRLQRGARELEPDALRRSDAGVRPADAGAAAARLPGLLLAVARERESGALALLRAHGATPAAILAGKGLALLAVALAASTPAWAVLTAAAIEAPAEAAAAATIALGYAVYLAIWTVAIVAVSALVARGRTALLALVALWSLTAVLAPRLAADVAQAAHPLASRAETDLAIQAELRQLGDSHDPEDPFFVAFRERTLAAHGVARVEDLPFNYRGALSAEGEALTSRLFDVYAARAAEALRRQSSAALAWAAVSPAIALRRLSMSAAASDLENHLRFLSQAEAFRFDFVQRLNALHRDAVAFADDAARSRDPEAERRTRVAAENWAALPDFRFAPAPAAERAAAGAAALAGLAVWLLAAVALAIAAAGRLARGRA